MADLYDNITMPPNLIDAHKKLDTAVMKLYEFSKDMSEQEIVLSLVEMYEKRLREIDEG